MRRLISLPLLALALVILPAVLGCGGPTVKTVPVSGKVTVGGQPAPDGNVSFVPVSAGDSKVGAPAGQIKNGEYTVSTAGKPGAPEGKYKVTVHGSMVPTGGKPPASFNRIYSDAKTTPLTIDVPSSNYDLKLEK